MLLHINGVHNGKIEIISFVVKFRSWPPITVNFDVQIKVWSRLIYIRRIFYFKLNGTDAINEITRLKTNSERTSSRQRNVKLKPLYEAFLMRIQEQVSENRSTVCTNMYGVCWKTCPPNIATMLSSKFEHVGDISLYFIK